MKFCVGCQSERPISDFRKILGKQILQSTCETCKQKDRNVDRGDRRLRFKYLSGDSTVGLCGCGRLFKKEVKPSRGLYNQAPVIKTECSKCRKEKA